MQYPYHWGHHGFWGGGWLCVSALREQICERQSFNRHPQFRIQFQAILQQMNRNTLNKESQRVAWLLQRPYTPPKRSAQADGMVSRPTNSLPIRMDAKTRGSNIEPCRRILIFSITNAARVRIWTCAPSAIIRS